MKLALVAQREPGCGIHTTSHNLLERSLFSRDICPAEYTDHGCKNVPGNVQKARGAIYINIISHPLTGKFCSSLLSLNNIGKLLQKLKLPYLSDLRQDDTVTFSILCRSLSPGTWRFCLSYPAESAAIGQKHVSCSVCRTVNSLLFFRSPNRPTRPIWDAFIACPGGRKHGFLHLDACAGGKIQGDSVNSIS